MIYRYLLIVVVASITGCYGIPSVSLIVYPITDFDQLIIVKEPIKKCGETDYIHLSKRKLLEIPTDLVKSETIKSVSLAKNEITDIDKDVFKNAPNLECLDLTQNRITLNHLRMQHNGLKTLILDYQRISEALDMSSNDIHNWFGSKAMLPNLSTLSLKGINSISKVDIHFLAKALPNLENIYLSRSNLDSMEKNISAYFPRLKRVYLDENEFDSFTFDNYGDVEELYLDNSSFKYLFLDVTFVGLKTLSLANCSLPYPTKFTALSLESLDLSRNIFMDIKADLFANMTNLENLNLGYNQLQEVPYLIYLNRLRKLSLNYNHITKLANMNFPKSLNVLSLRGNGLSVIDKIAFSNLHQLQALDLSENEIQSLPEGWDETLETLGHLNLRFNKFLNIQSMMINSLPNLEEFYPQGNNFDSIDANSLRQLPDNCTVYTF